MATTEPLLFQPLASTTTVDVCVAGAGIAGITTAYLLAQAGKSVLVLDHGPVGCGETSRTTAHLSNAIDDRFYELEGRFGIEGSRLAAQSHGAAVDCIESNVQRERIDCDFTRVDGYLFRPPGEPEDELRQELEASQRAGLSGVVWAPRAPLPSFDTGPCLRFPRQAQFHPLKYLYGLAHAIVRMGGRICTGTHVERIQGGSNGCRVDCAGGVGVNARAIVLATNTPIHENLQIHLKQAPYRTYVIAGKVPREQVTPALYWDTPDPYHYVRLQPSGDGVMLIAGGEDHRTGEEDDGAERFAALESWTRERFPLGEVEYCWSGQVMESVDGLGYIGRDRLDQPNVYFATGDSGQGMTHGTIAGMLIRDRILGVPNPWSDLYDPSRSPIATTEFLQENLDTAWHFFEWFTSGDVGAEDAIKPGEGAVIRRGLSKAAVYRDEKGRLHECSAVCPHLGCIVAWNSTERIWNCPCHGSRFDPYGRVLNGPSRHDLASRDHSGNFVR